MSILKKRSILKLAATFMLVAMMAGAFAVHTKAAVAATCTNNTAIPGDIPADTGADFCTDLITLVPNNVLNLTFSSNGTVNMGVDPVTVGDHTFTFTTTVIDTRGTEEGWTLQAQSAGLTDGTHFIPLGIATTGTSSSCTITITPTPPAGSDCGGTPTKTALTPITNSAPEPFMSVAATGVSVPISGTFVITVTGTYTIPSGAFGSYTGTIALSLLNTSTP